MNGFVNDSPAHVDDFINFLKINNSKVPNHKLKKIQFQAHTHTHKKKKETENKSNNSLLKLNFKPHYNKNIKQIFFISRNRNS